MGARYKTKCDQCGYRALLDNVLRSYELAEGVTLNIQQEVVWCCDCKAVTWREIIPLLADLERKFGEFERRDQEALDSVLPFVSQYSSLDDLISSRLDDLRRRSEWLKARQSPPHCLECGATAILPMAAGQTRSGKQKWTLSPHPDCDGTLTVLTEPVLSLNRLWIHYTPEGLRIAMYEMSPSKGAVPIANQGSPANSSVRHVSCSASLPQQPRRTPLSLTFVSLDA